MNITKRHIGKLVSAKLDFSSINGETFVNSFIKTIKKNLIEQKKVKLSGFGTLAFKETPQRIGRNPKTKESFIISYRNKVKLTISNKLRGHLN